MWHWLTSYTQAYDINRMGPLAKVIEMQQLNSFQMSLQMKTKTQRFPNWVTSLVIYYSPTAIDASKSTSTWNLSPICNQYWGRGPKSAQVTKMKSNLTGYSAEADTHASPYRQWNGKLRFSSCNLNTLHYYLSICCTTTLCGLVDGLLGWDGIATTASSPSLCPLFVSPICSHDHFNLWGIIW